MKRGDKFTWRRANRIIKAIRLGAWLQDAAILGGLNRITITRWIDRGEKGEAPYDKFLEKVEEAEGELLLRQAPYFMQHDDFRARQWWMVTRFRRRFEGKEDGKQVNPTINVNVMTPPGARVELEDGDADS